MFFENELVAMDGCGREWCLKRQLLLYCSTSKKYHNAVKVVKFLL